MDRLEAMDIFVRIVEAGSFSAVARELGTTQPTISKQITALETRLKTRLINRSTRSLSVTESGTAYYEQCKRILEDVKAAEGALGLLQSSLAGLLHVNGSIAAPGGQFAREAEGRHRRQAAYDDAKRDDRGADVTGDNVLEPGGLLRGCLRSDGSDAGSGPSGTHRPSMGAK